MDFQVETFLFIFGYILLSNITVEICQKIEDNYDLF